MLPRNEGAPFIFMLKKKLNNMFLSFQTVTDTKYIYQFYF